MILRMSINEPQITLVREDALLFTFSDTADPEVQPRLWQLTHHLQQDSNWHHTLREVVPGPGNLMLQLQPNSDYGLTDLTRELEILWKQLDPSRFEGRRIEISVRYGGRAGPDLEVVAQHNGLTPEEVIERHTAGDYRVLCLGFQPGFAYLGGLDEQLSTPRRATPRTRIPAGSVAIGGSQTGVYPADTPGGWHIIGHTDRPLFDPGWEQPCVLEPGDTVRFVREDGND